MFFIGKRLDDADAADGIFHTRIKLGDVAKQLAIGFCHLAAEIHRHPNDQRNDEKG